MCGITFMIKLLFYPHPNHNLLFSFIRSRILVLFARVFSVWYVSANKENSPCPVVRTLSTLTQQNRFNFFWLLLLLERNKQCDPVYLVAFWADCLPSKLMAQRKKRVVRGTKWSQIISTSLNRLHNETKHSHNEIHGYQRYSLLFTMKISVFHEDFYGNVILLFIENAVWHLKRNAKTSNKQKMKQLSCAAKQSQT